MTNNNNIKPISMSDSDSWCCLKVYGGRLKDIEKYLQQRFYTFIHTSNNIRSIGKKEQENARPTIPGLIFIQGKPLEVQKYLSEMFPNRYLLRDCATGKTAEIVHKVMIPFMKVFKLNDTTLYFVDHDISYYSKGRTLVRGNAGVLKDLEGYIVRFHRDKLLVLALANGFTIALAGVNKSTFQSPEDVALAQSLGLISK